MDEEIKDLEELDGVQEFEDDENTPEDVVDEINGDDDAHSNVHISSDVICKIAEIAALEIDGVASMYSGIVGDIAERLGAKKFLNKSVKLQMEGKNVTIDMYITIAYGAIMLDVASDVQENVKTNVETMTGLNVTSVNVHIEGVSFEKKVVIDEDNAVIDVDEDENN